MFKVGYNYTRQQIRDALGGGLQDYLPHDNGRVICGCFRKETNPDAPDIILPGTGRDIQKYARVFREQNYPVPVFLKKEVNVWVYVGDYQVERWTNAPSEIAKHAKRSGRIDITSVLFLKRR